MTAKGDVLQGTLDLIVLKTLDVYPALHGYGLAQRIQQVSDDLLQLNQGSLYPALMRLEQQGSIASRWGVSENNRRARFYTLTAAGRRRLHVEQREWERLSSVLQKMLAMRRA